MRLIDADDLILTILTNDLCGDDNVDKAIVNAPTVEAIPVEWIKKYINKIGASNGIMNMHREHLKTLIKDWEKENEGNL